MTYLFWSFLAAKEEFAIFYEEIGLAELDRKKKIHNERPNEIFSNIGLVFENTVKYFVEQEKKQIEINFIKSHEEKETTTESEQEQTPHLPVITILHGRYTLPPSPTLHRCFFFPLFCFALLLTRGRSVLFKSSHSNGNFS